MFRKSWAGIIAAVTMAITAACAPGPAMAGATPKVEFNSPYTPQYRHPGHNRLSQKGIRKRAKWVR